MDALLEYADPGSPPRQSEISLKMKINAAPDVSSNATKNSDVVVQDNELVYNPDAESLYSSQYAFASKNTLTGYVDDAYITPTAFDQNFYSYNAPPISKQKRKREPFGDASSTSGDWRGPWAEFEEDEEKKREFEKRAATIKVTEETSNVTVETEKKPDKDKEDEESEERVVVEAKSIFHGTSLRDYLGRTFVDPPSHLKPTPHECFLPKRLIHTWTGHTKAVNAIRFFPKIGHLLLSCSMDGKVKIWDVYNQMNCMRTYMGHSKGVRDICFSNDGRRFLSTSYDKNINLWDTETGQCIGSFSNGKIAYCIKFHPEDDRQHQFIAGCNDRRIIQWDSNSGKVVQVYDQHLAAVNTVTFVDHGRRFISSSDDKTIRVWETGIPVVIKYIAEPHMHSMPAITLTPDGAWFVGQSLDNQLLVYSTRDKFKMNKKKRFVGHLTAGYACQIDLSPDMHWITCGDADGKVWFWDWNTCKVLKSLKCHEGVAIDVKWHPIEPSRVATCGWDGTIKFWD